MDWWMGGWMGDWTVVSFSARVIDCPSGEVDFNLCAFCFLQVLSICPKDMRADICVHLNRKVRVCGLVNDQPFAFQVE